jgi:hypothetical protein
VFSTTVSTKIQALIDRSIKALVAFKPAFNPDQRPI